MSTSMYVMESVISHYSEEARWLRWMDAICFPDCEPFEFEGTNWYLLEYDGKYVGYAGWRNVDKYVGELCRAGVLPDWRGNEFQKFMIGFRESNMKRRGVLISVTTTYANNHHSMNNLIDCGYRACAKQEWSTIKASDESCVHFKKKL